MFTLSTVLFSPNKVGGAPLLPDGRRSRKPQALVAGVDKVSEHKRRFGQCIKTGMRKIQNAMSPASLLPDGPLFCVSHTAMSISGSHVCTLVSGPFPTVFVER
eukprot:scaffold329293_cov57-Tisochrysis_lutea.AAC.3